MWKTQIWSTTAKAENGSIVRSPFEMHPEGEERAQTSTTAALSLLLAAWNSDRLRARRKYLWVLVSSSRKGGGEDYAVASVKITSCVSAAPYTGQRVHSPIEALTIQKLVCKLRGVTMSEGSKGVTQKQYRRKVVWRATLYATLGYTTLTKRHYTTVNYTTLHYTTLYYTTLH